MMDENQGTSTPKSDLNENGKRKKQPRKSNTPFQRIKADTVSFADERLKDNSFHARVRSLHFLPLVRRCVLLDLRSSFILAKNSRVCINIKSLTGLISTDINRAASQLTTAKRRVRTSSSPEAQVSGKRKIRKSEEATEAARSLYVLSLG